DRPGLHGQDRDDPDVLPPVGLGGCKGALGLGRLRRVRGHDRFRLVTDRSVGEAVGAAHVDDAAVVRRLVETHAAFPFCAGVEDWEGGVCVCWWVWSQTAVVVMPVVQSILTLLLLRIAGAW